MALLYRILTNYSNNASPANCLLCASAPTNKHAFTLPCLHEYCYNCIFDCMEVRPRCPICTKPVTEIIYDVRDVNDYKTLSVDTIPTRKNVHFVLEQMLATLSQTYHLFLNHSDEINSFARQHRGEELPNRIDCLSWRLYMYYNGIYSLPVPDENGCLRKCSAAFYTANPNAIGRIWPWLSRELRALQAYISTRISSDFCKHIYDKLRVHDLYSIEFYNMFVERNFPFTNHFIYELHNFAVSSCNMVDYDSRVKCNPFFDRHYIAYTYTDLEGRQIENSGDNMDDLDDIVRPHWDESVEYGRAILYRVIRQNNNDVVSVDINGSNNNMTNINADNDNGNANVDDNRINSEEGYMTDDETPNFPYPTDPKCYCFAHRLNDYEGLENRPHSPPTYTFDNIKNLNSKELAAMVKCSSGVRTKKTYSVLLKDLLPSNTSSSTSIIFDSSSSDSDAACNPRMKTRSGNRKRKLLSIRNRNERKK